MANTILSHPAPSGQDTQPITQQNIELVLSDGVHFDTSIDEYVVVVDGEIVNYATHQGIAWFQYNEALRLHCKHVIRYPQDAILYTRNGLTTVLEVA